MAHYFKWLYNSIHGESSKIKCNSGPEPKRIDNLISTGIGIPEIQVGTIKYGAYTSGTASPDSPWYILQPPAIFPNLPPYQPSSFYCYQTLDILAQDIRDNLHFSMKKPDTGCEGLYGLVYFMQFPDIEIGFDIDVGAFLSGSLCCALLGLYLDDIYYPRRLMSWWPTRWFFYFVEENIYLQRSMRWFVNAAVIIVKTVYRALYGGCTHTISRMAYYWIRQQVLRGRDVPYAPLFDDTFAALISGYLWTGYTMETEQHTGYDRLIAIGWTSVFTGFVEYCLYQYFMKEPPPGLFRWLFGGAYYGPGVWRYLKKGTAPGEFF